MGAQCGGANDGAAELDYGVDSNIDEVRERFVQAGQGHVFNAWDDMDQAEQKKLLTQCSQFDVNNINQLYDNLVCKPQQDTSAQDSTTASLETVEPELITDKTTLPDIEKTTLTSIGQSLVKNGQVGVVVLAGGQGSRLGFNGPKGKFDLGLPSGKTLFQVLVERFFKVQMAAHGVTTDSVDTDDGESVPRIPASCQKCTMFVMTSYENHDETVQYFRDNAYFGGEESSFVFFPQTMLPAVDTSGKILMKSHHDIKLAPNGNGALFDALKNNELVRRAIGNFEYIQIIGVDNALNKVLDPIQLGITHQQNLQTSLKSCAKRNATEKVGVIGKKNGVYNIVEYSEIPAEVAGEHAEDGSLRFKHGHILVFVVRTDFMMRLCTGSAAQTNALYHKAFKKIDHCNMDTYEDVKPTEENGWKFELFLHSFLPQVEIGKLGVLMVDRETEFAPVKEADGPGKSSLGYDTEPLPDTPAWTKRMLMAEATQWLSAAEADGLRIDPETKGKIEVSYLLSYGGENLSWLKRVHKKAPLGGEGGYINHEGEYLQKD